MAYGTGHDSNVRGRSYLGSVVLCAVALAVLLVIGGVGQNPGSSVEAESIMQVLCSGCDLLTYLLHGAEPLLKS